MDKDSLHLLLVEDNEDHAALVLRAFETSNPAAQLSHVENIRDTQAFLEKSIPES